MIDAGSCTFHASARRDPRFTGVRSWPCDSRSPASRCARFSWPPAAAPVATMPARRPPPISQRRRHPRSAAARRSIAPRPAGRLDADRHARRARHERHRLRTGQGDARAGRPAAQGRHAVPGRRRQDRHLPRHRRQVPVGRAVRGHLRADRRARHQARARGHQGRLRRPHDAPVPPAGTSWRAKYTIDGKESTASGSINVADAEADAARRRRRAAVRHADDQVHRRRLRRAHDRRSAGQDAAAVLDRRVAEGEEAVRRRVRDPEVLRRAGCAARP